MNALLLTAVALAYDSEPVEIELHDQIDVFRSLEYDSGVIPSGSPIGVRARTTSRGGTVTDAAYRSELWWPNPLTHGFVGYGQGGRFALDTEIAVDVSAVLDLREVDLGVVNYSIWHESATFQAEAVFDDLLLPGDAVDPSVTLSSEGTVLGPIDTLVTVFTGVSLKFLAQAAPVATATLSGVALETDGETLDSIHDTVTLDVPPTGETRHITTWVNDVEATLDLVITPSAELCITVVGCFELARFDIPMPLGEALEERRLTKSYSHPIPDFDEFPRTIDFGDVIVGTSAVFDLPFPNTGDLAAEAWLDVEGDTSFRVFPDAIYAQPELADGVAVVFAPTVVGRWSALLVVETNDPLAPAFAIPMTGNAIPLPTPDVPDDGDPQNVPIQACGCDQGRGGAFGLVLVAPLLWRRRRGARTVP